MLCAWWAVPAPSPQRQACNIPPPQPLRAFWSRRTTWLAQTRYTGARSRVRNAQGYFPTFYTNSQRKLCRLECVTLTDYIHCPALPRKAPPLGCRPILLHGEKLLGDCEEGRTCADRIPDTSCTDVRHLLAREGSREFVS